MGGNKAYSRGLNSGNACFVSLYVHAFSFLEWYMSYHMNHGVRTFEILKIHPLQLIYNFLINLSNFQ